MSREKMLEQDNALLLFLLCVLMSLLVVLVVVQRNEIHSLPNCQEDEYLYPHDYRGPGKNRPSDYYCIHVDTIKENN